MQLQTQGSLNSVYDRRPRKKAYKAWIVFRRDDDLIVVPLEMHKSEKEDIFKIVFGKVE